MRLVLCAGETSGDQIAADLARELKRRDPSIELAGLAGPAMRQAGVEAWFDLDELNVMGLSEVIAHLPRLLRLRRDFIERILNWQPDAFIGVDAPDFNLGLARRLRKRGLTTMHYVSPSVWAWRAGRIPKIARSLDLLLTLFPFEPELYRPHGLKAEFVGHHLADELAQAPTRHDARATLGFGESSPLIALLPGSRGGELRRHAELIGETALRLRAQRPDCELALLLAREQDRAVIDELAGESLERARVRILSGRTRLGLRAADLAIAASGTVTLEAFLLGCPLVVYYRLAPTSYAIARLLRLVKTRHVSLPNILTGQPLVPECLQQQATAERLGDEALGWLEQAERIQAYREQSAHWANTLATGAGARAAEAILRHLGRA